METPPQAPFVNTRVLARTAITRTMEFVDYVRAVEEAFARHAARTVLVPPVVHVPARDGAFHVKSAALSGERAYVAVKVNGNFPGNEDRTGLPTIQGAITLCDGTNGFPLAILDSAEVTAQRTGAATAVAAKYLARADTEVATVVGCGIQGRIQLEALRHALPLTRVFAYDLDPERARVFAAEESARTGIPVTAVDRLAEGTRASLAIVTCTSSRSAFLGPDDVLPGTFVAAVGSDNDDKQELDPTLLASATIVVDILDQCATIGELHHALVAGVMQRSDVHADLGEVVSGARPGRTSPTETIVFDSTGSAIQDVAAAATIYERACEQDLGIAIELA